MDSLAAQLEALTPFGMEKSTPLWFYILKDTEIMESGEEKLPQRSRQSERENVSVFSFDGGTHPLSNVDCTRTGSTTASRPGDIPSPSVASLMLRLESMLEHVVGHAVALRDPLGRVE